jgi:protein arginine kinase activator
MNPDTNMQMCEMCGSKPANIHLTQVSSDETQVFHLCEECAKNKGISISINAVEPQKSGRGEQEVFCTDCGMSLTEFKQKGRLGCSLCYGRFGDDIKTILLQVHGACFHKGKQYRRGEGGLGSFDVQQLREELRQAIQNEKFEVAAVLRDKICSLTGESSTAQRSLS